MKSFWKKKLPSFLLALLMIVSLVPAAGAASADVTYEVEAGKKVTFDAADFSALKSFDYLEFTDYSDLDSVGYFTAYDKDDDKVTLDESDLDNMWFYYNENNIEYDSDCDLDTLTFVADEDADDTLYLEFELWKNEVRVFTGVLEIEIGGGSSSSDADVSYSVASGNKVAFDAADFYALKTFDYLEFTNYSKLDDYGYFTAYDKDDDKVTLDESDLDNLWFYYNENDIEYDSDCDLDTLTFVAKSGVRGTLTLTFELWRDETKRYTGTLEIQVGGTSGSGSSSSSSSADITYTVDENDDVSFDHDDFKAYFNKSYTGSLEYVRFTDISNLDECGALTTYTYDERNDDWDAVELDEDDALDGYFYYSDSDVTDDADTYCLDGLGFEADDNTDGEVVTLEFTAYGTTTSKKVNGTLRIEIGDVDSSSSSSSSADITYTVDENDDVSFDHDDFKAYFNKSYTGSLEYIRFTDISNLDDCGVLTTYTYDDRNDDWDAVELDEDDALDGYFYYSDSDVTDDADTYCLDGLGFEADDNTDGEVVTLEFTAYGTTTSKKINGTLRIEIGDVDNSSSGSSTTKADIEYTAKPEEEVEFDEEDFYDFFEESYSNYDLKYVVFTDSKNLSSSNGYLYYKYDRSSEVRFTASNLDDACFYYDENDIPDDDEDCYPLDDLSFVAGKNYNATVTLNFTAYYSSSKKVSGTLTISPESTAGTTSIAASILYTTTTGTNVQLKSNDFARFYESAVPNGTLKSVKLLAVPGTGSLFYNYYSKSAYGTSARLQYTAANCGTQALYLSPANTTQYSLTELTYVPANSTTNYTVSIPFAATGTNNNTVYGFVMISVTSKAIPEVYGVTPKNTAVSFPAPAISSAVKAGTSATLAKIQLLELPASAVGTIYVGSGTARKATTSDMYGVSGSSWTISQLRFAPASGYTGNVAIPYLAYDANNKAIGVGTFSLGVVSKQVKFSDVTSSTWCYKYVAELSDAGVVSGYTNGTFKPNNTITYGAALKLIMLAAGYDEQAPTVKGSTFSGYLDKARAEGIVTRSNVNLSGPITRLQVAQLAAGALDLDLDNLSSVAPFTDTTDKHVQALNAAGIVEGYFSNGTSTYKPGNTLTRGQVSAIVWRMLNYQ